MAVTMKKLHTAADAVRKVCGQADIAVILGSGLGGYEETLIDPKEISYSKIPGFPVSTVSGHAGKFVVGTVRDKRVLVMSGRFHHYEGHSLDAVTMPIRVMALMGVKTLIITNAAGGVNTGFNAGELMLITDFINLSGRNPLRGKNLDEFGPRFSINTRAYNPTLRALAHRVAQEKGINLREGVYVALAGPAFETPAEVRMLRVWGGDSVGMSTAHEVTVAYHTGMRILGFSSITNMSLDSTEVSEEVSHEDVLRLGKQIVPRLAAVLRGVLAELPPYDPSEVENQPEA